MSMMKALNLGGTGAFISRTHKDLLMVICIRDTVRYVRLENLYYHYSQLKSAEIAKYSDRMSSYISEYGRIQHA